MISRNLFSSQCHKYLEMNDGLLKCHVNVILCQFCTEVVLKITGIDIHIQTHIHVDTNAIFDSFKCFIHLPFDLKCCGACGLHSQSHTYTSHTHKYAENHTHTDGALICYIISTYQSLMLLCHNTSRLSDRLPNCKKKKKN